MAREIGLSGYYYDVAALDTCPNCGKELHPVSFYGGKLVDFRRSKEQGLLADGVRTTRTYGDFVQLRGGYCFECEKRKYDEENKGKGFRSARKWFLIFLITAVASLLGAMICSRFEASAFTQLIAILFGISFTGLIPSSILYIVRLIRKKSDRESRMPSSKKLSETLVLVLNGSPSSLLAAQRATGMDAFFTPDAMKKI